MSILTKIYPPLYKKNVQGKIEKWKVSVIRSTSTSYSIVQKYGEMNGKQIEKRFGVFEGKNIGKKNETTTEQQAIKEAQAKFDVKLKQGYCRSLADAKKGKVDSVIKGGIVPMSAFKWQDYKDKVKYPLYIQPKLDGERCIAIVKKGKVTLWTRSRKQIHSCPHIVEQLKNKLKQSVMETEGFIFDGEIYIHDVSVEEREKIMGAVRKQKSSNVSLKSKYYIYDIIPKDVLAYPTFKNRMFHLRSLFFRDRRYIFANPDIKIVNTYEVIDKKEIDTHFKSYKDRGYEGLMIRDPDSLYEHKRSKGLLKYKSRDDGEFKIIGVQAGKDETVIFECVTKEGKKFKATKAGDKKDNQKYLKNSKKYIGKMLTVEYQGFTGKNKVPLFPTAIRIREEV